jgi:hypothetical protein
MAILMTVQLAQQLIAHYERCINDVKLFTTLEGAKAICKEYSAERGVCYCANIVFDESIYGCEWLLKNSTFTITTPQATISSNYITNVPAMCDTIPDIISALQTRVDILKTFNE